MPVHNGNPFSSLNRRVIHLRLLEKEIECAEVASIMGGKGSVWEMEVLGRTTVPLIRNLELALASPPG